MSDPFNKAWRPVPFKVGDAIHGAHSHYTPGHPILVPTLGDHGQRVNLEVDVTWRSGHHYEGRVVAIHDARLDNSRPAG